MATVKNPLKLSEMSREALDELRQRVDSELEARAFEEQLRRELQSHMNRREWMDRHHAAQRRR